MVPRHESRKQPHARQRWRAATLFLLFLALKGVPAGGALAPSWHEVPSPEPLRVWLARDPALPPAHLSQALKAARLLLDLLEEDATVGVVNGRGGGEVAVPPDRLTAAHRRDILTALSTASAPGGQLSREQRAWRKQTGPPAGREALVVLTAAGGPAPGPERLLTAAPAEGLVPFVLPVGAARESGAPAPAAGLPENPSAFADPSGAWADACLSLYHCLASPQIVPFRDQGFLLDASVHKAMWFLPVRGGEGRPGLTDPQGKKWPAGHQAPGVAWQAGEGYFLARVQAPRPGWWRVWGVEGERVRGYVQTSRPLRVWLSEVPLRADLRPWVAVGLSPPPEGSAAAVPGFSLLCRGPGEEWRPVPLQEPSGPGGAGLPEGVRVGLLPPASLAGIRELRATLTGPGLFRERLLALPVHPPRAALREDARRLFLTDFPGAGGGTWLGWLSLRGPGAGLSGRFLRLSAGGGPLAELPGLTPGTYAIAAEVWSPGLGGYGPIVRPAVQSLSLSGAAGAPRSEAVFPTGKAASLSDLSRPPARRLARVAGLVCLLLGAALLLLVAALWRQDRTAPEAEASGDVPGLLAAEQLQALLEERARLTARVEELERETRRLQRENEDLRREVEARAGAIQEKSRMVEQWRAEAEKAQKEALAVQEEYTALFARSHRDKEVLRRS